MSQHDKEMKADPYEDDTISLIDLIAVVVRHRWVIGIGTFLVILVTAGVLYLAPAAGIGSTELIQQYRVEQKLQVQQLSNDVTKYIIVDVGAAFRDVMTDPAIIEAPYRDFFRNSDISELSPEELVTFLSNEFIGNAYTVTEMSGSGMMRVSLVGGDAERAKRFISAVTERARQELSVRLAPQLSRTEAMIASTIDLTSDSIARVVAQTVMEEGLPGDTETVNSLYNRISESASEEMRELRDLGFVQQEIASIKGNAGVLITVVDEPLVYALPQETRDPAMILVIATITAFFLTVFLAFVLEYVRRVRKDPEEMGKLRAAWRREDV